MARSAAEYEDEASVELDAPDEPAMLAASEGAASPDADANVVDAVDADAASPDAGAALALVAESVVATAAALVEDAA